MTSKERVQMTFKHQQPDRAPIFEQSICSRAASTLLGRKAHVGGGNLRRAESDAWLNGEDAHAEFGAAMINDVAELVKKLRFDMVRIPWRNTARPTKKLDDTTYLYGDFDGNFSVCQYIESSDIFETVDSTIKRRGLPAMEEAVQAMEKNLEQGWKLDEQVIIDFDTLNAKAGLDLGHASPAGGISIPFDSEWLEATIEAPDLVHRYLNCQCEMGIIAMQQYSEHGADCFWAGGDLADNRGVVYGPKAFRNFILPPLKRLAEQANKLKIPYLFRTDGDTYSIADDLFLESGIHGYGEIDVDAGMDMYLLKKRFPKLTLWGGMSCGRLLVDGTEAEIRAEAEKLLRELSPNGGYIFGSSNSINSGVSVEKFLIMLDAAYKFMKM